MSDSVPLLHPNQLQINADIVRRLIDTQFPDGRGLPLRRHPSTGTVNAIYRVGEFSVRLPLLVEFAHALTNEVHWLPRLARHLPLACPEVVAVGQPAEEYPHPWAVFRWIDGTPWTNDGVRDEVAAAETLAAFIDALQGVDTGGAPAARRGRQGAAVRDRDPAVRAALRSTGGMIDTGALETAWDRALAAPDWSAAPVWVHGDLLAPNLLLRHGELHAVLDFGNACVGDPAVDIAAAWALFGPVGRQRFRAAVNVDDATWARARGWALTGVQGVGYYAETNPEFAADCRRRVEAALSDE